jgi:hypothetical protein
MGFCNRYLYAHYCSLRFLLQTLGLIFEVDQHGINCFEIEYWYVWYPARLLS